MKMYEATALAVLGIAALVLAVEHVGKVATFVTNLF